MHSFGLKKRIFVPLILVGIAVVSVGFYFVDHLEEHQKNDAVMQLSESMRNHIRSLLDAKAEMLVANLQFIVRNPAIVAALKQGNRQKLLALANPIYRRLNREENVTHFYFDDVHRVNLLRVHKPERYGDTINRFTALGAEKMRRVSCGIELGPLGTFTLRCVTPVFEQGELVGYIELGQEIDEVLRETHRMFHVEMFMLIGKQYLYRNTWEEGMRMLGHAPDWGLLKDAVVVSRSVPTVPVDALNRVASVPQQSGIRIGQDIDMGGRHYWAGIIPMQDAGGRTVGSLVVLRDMSDLVHHANHELLVFIALFTGLGVLILILFYFVLDRAERRLAEARHELERALHIQRVLDTILNISLPPLTLKEVMEKSLEAILSMPAFTLLNQGAIFLLAPGEQVLEIVAQRNLPESLLRSCGRLPLGKCLCGTAAAKQEMVFVNHLDDAHEIRYDGIQEHGHYCMPITSEGKTLGVLNLYVQHGHVGDESERKFMKTVADTLGAVIERKQAEAQLERMAHNDLLTGLPNRTLFYDRMNLALALAQRERQKFAVLFLDLDHFKEVNDRLGHDLGDVLLKQVALRLLGCVRGMDTVARMGGDEFTVILTNTRIPDNAETVAEKIVKTLSEPFDLGGAPQTIGCSIGIAIYPAHGEDSETLLKHADIAMYYAKRERNTFCFFQDGLRDVPGRGPSRQS